MALRTHQFPAARRSGCQTESGSVNGDVMVEPAQCRQIVRVVAAVVRALANVVRLEPISTVAADHGASTIAPGDKSAHRRRDDTGAVGGDDGLAILEAY